MKVNDGASATKSQASAASGGKDISPVGLAFLGVGTFMDSMGRYRAMIAQSQAEGQNADFYRKQAAFAQEVGDRQRMIFGRESEILFGEQKSGFAKAGLSVDNSSFFLATQMANRSSESYAIERETQMNVDLASARAVAADQASKSARRAANDEEIGTYVKTAATIAMFL